MEKVKACRAGSINAKPATTRGEKGINREFCTYEVWLFLQGLHIIQAERFTVYGCDNDGVEPTENQSNKLHLKTVQLFCS